ncbi:hypothetical protein MVEN_02189400 [Mycena venus]|uniref:Uncharacterized protein n=1 Tax=Mycena venus TaxID=2733690 RepID=A0A8H6X896_9AGAR|nr:hypothetical protein MVEN_02189400 [Mycena venus]
MTLAAAPVDSRITMYCRVCVPFDPAARSHLQTASASPTTSTSPSSSAHHSRAPFANPSGMMSQPPTRSTAADALLVLPLVAYESTPILVLMLACARPYLALAPVYPCPFPYTWSRHTCKATRCIQQFGAVEHDPAPSPALTHSLNRAHAARPVDVTPGPAGCLGLVAGVVVDVEDEDLKVGEDVGSVEVEDKVCKARDAGDANRGGAGTHAETQMTMHKRMARRLPRCRYHFVGIGRHGLDGRSITGKWAFEISPTPHSPNELDVEIEKVPNQDLKRRAVELYLDSDDEGENGDAGTDGNTKPVPKKLKKDAFTLLPVPF